MDWILFVIFLVAMMGAGTTGAIFPPGDWYDRLDKPGWTPPDWAFPVVWTVLYVFIAVAAARAAPLDASGYAMAAFAVQVAFNTLWTPVFFGLRKIGPALGVLAVLWLSVAATGWLFWGLDPLAGALFVPYLAWVTVAFALNLSVWRRNPHGATA